MSFATLRKTVCTDIDIGTTIVFTLEGRGVNTSVLIGSVLAELGYEENGNE